MRISRQAMFSLVLNGSVLITMLAGCAPSAPVPTSVPPTAVLTLAPTAEPSATPEPTSVPMPEGWWAIYDTREIGGLQVVVNERGEAATQIDSVFYPVDAKGCFYTEFYDPEVQKQNPVVMELVEKINGEEPFMLKGNTPIDTRHVGSTHIGRVLENKFPAISERMTDAILMDQRLCYNQQTGEWEHVLDYVPVGDLTAMPDETLVVRSVVGWLRDKKYVSFTYRQDSVRSKEFQGQPRDVSGLSDKKATMVGEAFDLWQNLIDSHEQVGVGTPFLVIESLNTISSDERNFEPYLRQVVTEAPQRNPAAWKDNLSDPDFVDWALSAGSQMRYLSDDQRFREWYMDHYQTPWRYWGEQATVGAMPELVARTVWVQKK